MIKQLISAALVSMMFVSASSSYADDKASETRQFTFAWPFLESGQMRPRGGTSKGPAVTLAKAPTAEWTRLVTARERPAFERDRLAILAMAGGFRTSFDFLETAGFTDQFKADRPYQSWTTEYVYVVEDAGTFISLQHIIVMYFAGKEGKVSPPMVVKHWRQDWTYEDRDLHLYVGHKTWARKRLEAAEVKGRWSQAVYQVDDSPRYEALGRWLHYGNYSSWESETTWRPLPRREFSVRKDYHVLAGTNRHTITPTGWVQEEDNLKLVLSPDGKPSDAPVLAREIGLNRYERIVEHNFKPGDAYWDGTQLFWRDVREAWRDIYQAKERFSLVAKVDDKLLFQRMFGYASKLLHGDAYDQKASKDFIRATLARYLR